MEKLTVNGYSFEYIIDGLLVNPDKYETIDPNWVIAVTKASLIFSVIYGVVEDLHCSIDGFVTYEEAKKHVARLHGIAEMYQNFRDFQEILFSENVILPQDVLWYIQAVLEIGKPQPLPHIQKPEPLATGYIYLVQSPSGHYKIGKAKDVTNRLKTFEVKMPFEIELIHVIPCSNYHKAESKLHKQYANKRLNGEWFELTPEDVATIKSIERM